MKIFSKNPNLGNKANNLIILSNKKIKIPDTFIIGADYFSDINLSFLDEEKNYILRPSFQIEDSENLSYAGFFKSLFPIKKEEIIAIFKSKNINSYFNGLNYDLKSIIIEIFIETNKYGVYFTKNPNNIFKRGFYEIGENNDGITAGKVINNKKLSFMESKELEIIGNKLEKLFNCPQDIEFCIKNDEIFTLQSRPITTGNYTIYNFSEIRKINGLYKYLDFDEFGEKQDFFSYFVLKGLFRCIFIENKIYFKISFPPFFIINKAKKEDTNLYLFYKSYKKYLVFKYFYYFIKFLSFRKLDKTVIIDFFKDYKYSFKMDQKSNLNLSFDYKTDFITKMFLKVEKLKNYSFYYLEEYKKIYSGYNFCNTNSQYDLKSTLIFYRGILVGDKKEDDYIYKGSIKGVITDMNNYDKNKKNQVLICDNLDFNIYDKLDNLSGLIIKYGNKLSHNSIILREYKIPCIINYREYDNLQIGTIISL